MYRISQISSRVPSSAMSSSSSSSSSADSAALLTEFAGACAPTHDGAPPPPAAVVKVLSKRERELVAHGPSALAPMLAAAIRHLHGDATLARLHRRE